MSGKKFLLDTNIIIGLFASDENIVGQIKKAKELFIPSIALGELFYGAEQSAKKEINKNKIEAFAKASIVLHCDADTAKHYGSIKSRLKKNGTPIPENDIWIGALTVQYKLRLVTRDNHFRHIDAIISEEW